MPAREARWGLAAASLVCGIVPFALVFRWGRDFGTWPVAFAVALVAVVVGVAAGRRAKAAAAPSSIRWLANGGTALGLSFLAFVGLTLGVGMLRRAAHRRWPSESVVLQQLRTLIWAEWVYRESVGKGHFCSISCLATPALCVPGYTGAPFLVEPFVSDPYHSGYRRTFHAGAVAPEPAVLSPAGRLVTFAYTAVPLNVGVAGVRGFCADSTGRICFTTDGSAPPVKDGLCDPGCNDLR